MKKNIIFGLAIILFTSCGESFLKENPQNFETQKNTYATTNGFKAAKNGLYSYARLEFQTWTDGVIQQGACNYETLQVGTDVCLVGQGDATLVPFEKYTFNNSTSYIKNRWKWAYGLIANANEIINNAEKPTVDWQNATDKTYFQAQGYFFRAYAYRYLVYLYGDVPWVTETASAYHSDFKRTPKAEVLKNMIADLEKAALYLPENPSVSSTFNEGELTKWAALHLLSDVCLLSGDYTRAKTAALEVINSGYFKLNKTRFGKHTGEPGDYYSDMFKENNHNRASGNPESIWVMQAEYDVQGGGKNYCDWTRRAWVPSYFQIKGFIISPNYGGRGLGQIRPTDAFLTSFEPQDIRNSEYNIRRNFYYNDPTSPLFGTKHTITATNIAKGQCFPAITKFDYGVTANPVYEGVSKDRTKFRLAETYLLLAEAYIRLNDIPKAKDAINEVRLRAGASLAPESAINMDYLLDERSRELIGEELRRFTLVRTGKLIERVKKFNAVSGPIIKETNVLWPIPQEVIDANSGEKWINNDGY
jgi:hypothetical protein